MNEFEEYRRASNEMEGDKQVQEIRAAIAALQLQLEQAEYPYRIRLSDAAARIVEKVLGVKKTVTLWGVTATYITGRKSTSWKAVAIEMDAPPSLVTKHTTVGDPSVKISLAN